MAKTKYEENRRRWASAAGVDERGSHQSRQPSGDRKLVNERVVVKKRSVKPLKAPRPTRVLRGWRPSRTRAAAFDALVAEQKNTSGKNGPQLIDEALDLLLKRYDKH